VFGVFYGFSHQTAISTKDKVLAEKHEYDHKQKLINDAKAAWQRKNAPGGGSGGMSTTPYLVEGCKKDCGQQRSCLNGRENNAGYTDHCA
jgi:hypothetical protein